MGNESSCCCYDDSVVSLEHVTSSDGSSNKRSPRHGPRMNHDVVRTDAGTHMPSLMPTTLTTAQQRRRREEADEYEYEDIAVMIGHRVSPKPPANNCGAKSHNTSATSSSLQHDGFLSRRNPISSRRPSSSAGGPTSDMAGFSFTTSHNLSSDATRPQSSQSDIPSSPDPGSRSREECGEDNESGPQPAASSPRVPRPVVGSSSQPPQLVMHRSGVPLTAVTAEFGFSLVPVNPNSVPRRAAGDGDSGRDGWSPMKHEEEHNNSEEGDTVGFGLVDLQPSAEPDRDARFVAPDAASRSARHASQREDSTATPRRRTLGNQGPLGSPSTPMHRGGLAASSLGGSLVDAHSSIRRFQGATDSLGLYRSEEEGGYMGRGVGHDVDTPATLDASFGDVFGERDLEGSYRGR